jgi:hypothetical protein
VPGGRPCKLTPELQQCLCDAIRAGSYYRPACGVAGVDYATFRRWMLRGRNARSGQFREFCEAVRKAEADAEVRMVAQWQSKIPADWRAARDFLARRFPRRWMPREARDVQHGGAVPVEVREVIVTSREQADQEIAALTAASGVPRQ